MKLGALTNCCAYSSQHIRRADSGVPPEHFQSSVSPRSDINRYASILINAGVYTGHGQQYKLAWENNRTLIRSNSDKSECDLVAE